MSNSENPAPQEKKMYLYFLKNDTLGITKVGSSVNPQERMKCVMLYDQKGKYKQHKFTPLYICEITDRGVEEKAHKILKSQLFEREWFFLGAAQERYIDAVCKILRLEKIPVNN